MSRWVDHAAERAVLAAVMLDPGADVGDGVVNRTLTAVSAVVRPDDLDHPAHHTVYAAMLRLGARRSAIDVVTLCAELRAEGRLNAVGGPQFVGELTDEIPTLAFAGHHAKTVADLALVRRRREALAEALHHIDAGGLGLDETLVAVDRAASRACEARPSGAVTAHHHGQSAIEYLQSAREARERGRSVSARFGLESLDGARDGSHGGRTGGVPGTRVIGVSAPPGAGKTTLVTQSAIVTAEDGGGVLWFSTEIPGREIAIRYACQHADPPVSQVDALSGAIDQATFGRLARHLGPGAFGRLPIKIWSENLRIEHIAATVSAECAKGGVRLVVLDYFQDLEGGEGESETTSQQARARIIKSIARDNHVGVLLVSSLTKEAEKAGGKRATTANLSGAGVRYASDVVIELARDPDARPDEAGEVAVTAQITKHRYGIPGAVPLLFDGARGRFRDASRHVDHGAPPEAPDDDGPAWPAGGRDSDAGDF